MDSFPYLKQFSLLYVEDDEAAREMYSSVFKKIAREVYIAQDGKEGLELYGQHQPDVVVTDIKMPLMGGIELCSEIKLINPYAQIIITSAYSDVEFLTKAIEIGISRYIIKPIQIDHLMMALEECIGQLYLKKIREDYTQQMEMLVNLQESMVVMCDGQVPQMLNQKTLQFFGVDTKEEFINKYGCISTQIDWNNPPVKGMTEENWVKTIEQHSQKGLKVPLLHPETQMIHTFLVRANKIHPDATQYVIVFTDVTAQEHEQEMLRQEMKTRAKMADLGEMLRAVTHQWKQPLQVIKYLLSDLLEQEGLDQEIKSAIEVTDREVTSQIKYLTHTIDDFRHYFRPDGAAEEFHVEKAVEQSVGLVNFAYEKIGVKVHVQIQEGIICYGVLNDLVQVLIVLLNNARDAIEHAKVYPGEINVSTAIQDDVILIRIEDNGGGIREDLLPDRLFELHLTTKGEKGDGIGLYLAQDMIRSSFDGEIEAANSEKGAVFTITLPSKKCYWEASVRGLAES